MCLLYNKVTVVSIKSIPKEQRQTKDNIAVSQQAKPEAGYKYLPS